jgi:hypothetical protein
VELSVSPASEKLMFVRKSRPSTRLMLVAGAVWTFVTRQAGGGVSATT